jgi:polyisoprenoid-binding protein YceI
MTSTVDAAGTAQLGAGTWAIDPVHSSISFSVRHLMVSKVRGRFENFSGAIVVAEDGTPSVTAEIAVDSISTNNEQRDAHIKSADFFEVENTPPHVPVHRRADQQRQVCGRRRLHPQGRHQTRPLDLEFNG